MATQSTESRGLGPHTENRQRAQKGPRLKGEREEGRERRKDGKEDEWRQGKATCFHIRLIHVHGQKLKNTSIK